MIDAGSNRFGVMVLCNADVLIIKQLKLLCPTVKYATTHTKV